MVHSTKMKANCRITYCVINRSNSGNIFHPRIRAKALSYRFGGDVTQPFRVDAGMADYAAPFMSPFITMP
jgi:hypothetical protein